MFEFIFWVIVILGIWGWIQDKIGSSSSSWESEDFQASSYSDLEIKIELLPREDGQDYDAFGVFFRGNPGITTSDSLYWVFKLEDLSSSLPIQGTFDAITENNSKAFEHRVPTSEMYDKYWPNWTQMSAIYPDSIIGPYSGSRTILLYCYVWPDWYVPECQNGKYYDVDFSSGKGYFEHSFNLNLPNIGYLEVDESRLEMQKAAVKLAMSIAMADGSLDTSEGNVIKAWMTQVVDSAEDSQRDKVKRALNSTLKMSHNEASGQRIDIEDVCTGIVDKGSKADKFSLLELCLDVMAADGKADKEELNQINRIASLIGIDYEEVRKMKDQRIIKLDPNAASNADLEETVGIDTTWDNETIRKHIISEYSKWNGRLTTLPEGPQRENAQKMLNKIAEARRKYSK